MREGLFIYLSAVCCVKSEFSAGFSEAALSHVFGFSSHGVFTPTADFLKTVYFQCSVLNENQLIK